MPPTENSRSSSRKTTYYPKAGCGLPPRGGGPANGTAAGAFQQVLEDLIAVATRRAWRGGAALNRSSTRCFERKVQSCLRRWQGALDGPAVPKTAPYFWPPPWSTAAAAGPRGAWLPPVCVDGPALQRNSNP